MDKHHVKLSKSNIEAVLRLPWREENYSKRIWKREFNVAHKVKELVTQNILAGTSIDNLTRQVTNELGKDYENSAKRLIRTETAYVKGQGDLLTYNKLGIDEYQFSSVLDGKTSKTCRGLDGKVFKVNEAQVGVTYPPMHPNCRSITIKAKDKRDGTRVARDKHGKSIEVPADMTYKEWYETYVESDPEYLAKEKAWKNRHSDRKQYERYKEVLGKKKLGNFEQFQNLKYNHNSKYSWERLKDNYHLQNNFKKGVWKDEINPEKQERHMEGTQEDKKSYFYKGVDVELLYKKYSGRGVFNKNKGRRTHVEHVNIDEVDIGFDVLSNKLANGMSIHYSKTGTHLFPIFYKGVKK